MMHTPAFRPVLTLALTLTLVAPVHLTAVAAEPAPASSAASAALAEATVRKVDVSAGKITLRHGPIPNLDMPPMTMVFQVADPALLEQVKAGDTVRFHAEKIGSAYTVMRIELIE